MTTFGMISPYPPTPGDLATFANQLRSALLAGHAEEVRIVRLGELPHADDPPEVVAWLVDGSTDTGAAATALNECDVALLQHDVGAYSRADGQDILRVAGRLRVPAIAVLHTVPASPARHQREVLETLMDRVDAIVVTSDAAADRLLADYAVDAAKIAVISHPAEVPQGPGVPRQDRSEDSSASGERSPATAPDWAAVSAGYGRLASLLRAEHGRLLV